MKHICKDIINFIKENNFIIASYDSLNPKNVTYLYYKNILIHDKNISIWLFFSMNNRCGAVLNHYYDSNTKKIEIGVTDICFSILDNELKNLIMFLEKIY